MVALLNTTSENKDGESMADSFEQHIDAADEAFGCIAIAYLTDCDGGSEKGRRILVKRRPWMLSLECWAHQVRSLNFLFAFY